MGRHGAKRRVAGPVRRQINRRLRPNDARLPPPLRLFRRVLLGHHRSSLTLNSRPLASCDQAILSLLSVRLPRKNGHAPTRGSLLSGDAGWAYNDP